MAEDQQLGELMSTVMRGRQPMTEKQIVKAIYRRAKVKTDARHVRLVLYSHPRRFSRILPPLRFFVKWQLVEAGPADDPGNAGAPVPTRPYPPTLSGAAAAELIVRDDEPPANAIGKTA